MAQRRMFSMHVVDTDLFLDMPSTAQALYFHLSMRADDDGFVSSPRKIMKVCNASDDDYKLLMAKRFVIPFDSGICVIRHWRIHNYIQKDRYNPTMYHEEKAKLEIENGHYEELDTECIHDVSKTDTQVRLGKVRQGKESQGKTKSSGKTKHPTLDLPMNQTRYDHLCSEHGKRLVDWAMQARFDWEGTNGKTAAKDYASAASGWIEKAKEFGTLPRFAPEEKHCPQCGKPYLGFMCISCGWEQPE